MDACKASATFPLLLLPRELVLHILLFLSTPVRRVSSSTTFESCLCNQVTSTRLSFFFERQRDVAATVLTCTELFRLVLGNERLDYVRTALYLTILSRLLMSSLSLSNSYYTFPRSTHSTASTCASSGTTPRRSATSTCPPAARRGSAPPPLSKRPTPRTTATTTPKSTTSDSSALPVLLLPLHLHHPKHR